MQYQKLEQVKGLLYCLGLSFVLIVGVSVALGTQISHLPARQGP